MKQLINITTIPFKMDIEVQPARLDISSKSASGDAQRVKGVYSIEHTSPKLQIDTTEARSSMGQKSMLEASKENAAKSMQAAKDGAIRIAAEGDSLMRIQSGVTVRDIAADRLKQRIAESCAYKLGPLPSVPADISWEPGSFSIHYEADQLNLDWSTQYKPEFQFTPAEVHYKVLQFAKCEIEYIGGPLYVPPSSDPNYDKHTLDTFA